MEHTQQKPLLQNIGPSPIAGTSTNSGRGPGPGRDFGPGHDLGTNYNPNINHNYNFNKNMNYNSNINPNYDNPNYNNPNYNNTNYNNTNYNNTNYNNPNYNNTNYNNPNNVNPNFSSNSSLGMGVHNMLHQRDIYNDEYGGIENEILEKQYEIIKCAKHQDFHRMRQAIQPFVQNNDIDMLNEINIFHWACYCNDIQLVNKLIGINCDPFKEDLVNCDTPIYYAIKNSNYEMVLKLINTYGKNIIFHKNRRKMTPFLTAVSEFNEEKILEALHILELLYLNGVSLEEQNEHGQTAIFLCVKKNNISVLQWLLTKNVNINHRDFYGNTILHIAVRHSDIDIIRLLCDFGCLNLVYYSSIENKHTNVFQLCIKNRYFLVYILLKKWIFQHKFCKHLKTCKTIYVFYFWFFALLNLIIFLNMAYYFSLLNLYRHYSVTWLSLFSFQQFLWCLLYFRNPGFYKENILSKTENSVFINVNKKNDNKNKYKIGYKHINRNANTDIGIGEGNGNYSNMFPNPVENVPPHKKFERTLIKHEQHLFSIYKIFNTFDLMTPEELEIEKRKGNHNIYNEQNMKKLQKSLIDIECQKMNLYASVSVERINASDKKYVESILNNNNPRGVCVTCNIIKPTRVHHCADCLHCIVHQDHHCVWVDNCIGLKNQRTFYLFVLCVFLLLVFNYYYVFLYLFMFYKTINYIFALLILLSNFINFTLLVFISYLFFRNTRTILTNVTFYEHYKKPNHIAEHYNTDKKCWDFQNLTFKKILKNIYYFWSLNYNEPYIKKHDLPNKIGYRLISERI